MVKKAHSKCFIFYVGQGIINQKNAEVNDLQILHPYKHDSVCIGAKSMNKQVRY